MCNKKPRNSSITENINEEMDEDSDSSDVSMTDSESEDDEEQIETSNIEELDKSDIEENVQEEEEEEDETIKAIKRESNRERDHPPNIQCEDFITDISFHPQQDILAVANIVGDVLLYKYTNESNTLLNTLELHTRACRDIEFSLDGVKLFSASKDKSIMISDVDSGKLIQFYENSHDVPLYCLTVIDEHVFSTGKQIKLERFIV